MAQHLSLPTFVVEFYWLVTALTLPAPPSPVLDRGLGTEAHAYVSRLQRGASSKHPPPFLRHGGAPSGSGGAFRGPRRGRWPEP